MPAYPVLLDLTDVGVLVVGGGTVALRKVEGLLRGGGRPDLVSPEVVPPLSDLIAALGLRHRVRRFEAGDAAGYALVIAATDDRAVNARIAAEARERGVWVNVVDDPAASNFIVPAVLREGEVVAAISTGGASPLLASGVRERLESVVTPGLGRAAARLLALREEVQSRWPEDEARRRSFWRVLVTGQFLDSAIAGKDDEVEARIEACLSRS